MTDFNLLKGHYNAFGSDNSQAFLEVYKENNEGLLFHTFWRGDLEEIYDGLRFVYYEKDELINIFKESFKIVSINYYSEEEDSDSIYIILRKRQPSA